MTHFEPSFADMGMRPAHQGVRLVRRLRLAMFAASATLLAGCLAFATDTEPNVNVGGDVTPPTPIAFTPANLSTDVPIAGPISVTFSEPMRNATLTSSFTLRKTTGNVVVPGSVTVVSNTATFVPTTPLAVSTQYTAAVSTEARDVAGNALVPGVAWTFTTEAAPVTSLVVLPNPVTVIAGTTQQFGVTGRRTADPAAPVAVSVTWTATGGTISPTGLFTAGAVAGTTYIVTATLASNSAVTGRSTVTVISAPPPPPGTGVWLNVTPSNVDLTNALSCGNFGTETVQADPDRPSNLYAQFHCQGIWKSVDYGRTWTGPINTGTNGTAIADCAGGIRLAKNGTPTPTLLLACIRGTARGFWRSTDGGVNWTKYNIAPDPADRQDMYPPMVDPYDPQHLLMAAHEHDALVESVDGGRNWTNIPLNPGMLEGVRSAAIAFINTGSAATTRTTWLWIGEQSGGQFGTWRTTNSGTTWTQVSRNEHPVGYAETFQLDASGVMYMAGFYAVEGNGVLRSTDFGVTWAQVGNSGNQRVVFGTPKNMYSSYSFPSGLNTSGGPSFQLAPQPGTGTWTSPTTPAAMRQGAAQVAITNDGTRSVFVTANYGAGLWLYIEP